MSRRSHSQRVVMLGASLDAPGGMTSVALAYRDAGLFERWSVLYLPTFLRAGWRSQLRTFPCALLRLLGWLLTGQVALVHANSASRGSFFRKSICCATAWLLGVPYVFHIHSGEFPAFYWHEASVLVRWWVRWVLRHAAVVLVLTPSWSDEIGRMAPGARISVLVNPIPVPNKAVEVRDPPERLLFLGRLRAKKGVFDLVRALPAILAAYPSVRVCIAGDEDLAGVQALARQLQVAHAVDLPGWLAGDAKQAALMAADLLILPSHFEALGMCVLEAMAIGVPVVAARVGGVPFVLDDGACGVLVEPADPAALAAAVCGLLGDRTARVTYAARARQRAIGVFSSSHVASELDGIWSAVAGSTAGAGPVQGSQG